MIDLIMRDKVLLQMHQDAMAGRPSTQLTLATALSTDRGQICNAIKKLTKRELLVKGELLGAPPNRGTYCYKLTKGGMSRARELEEQQ